MEDEQEPKRQDTGEDAKTAGGEATKELEDEDMKDRFVVTRRPKIRNREEGVSKSKAVFPNTRRKLNSVRRRVKRLWKVWVNFKGIKGVTEAAESKVDSKTFEVPGFEEIACIEAEVPDIMMTDADKIRTSCARCQEKPPLFPSREQVKSKLIAADKYYGRTGSNRIPKGSRDNATLEHEADYYDEDGSLIRPSWRFILERPLVEQYVLMTNYIRKVSVLSELTTEKNLEVIEEPNIRDDEIDDEIVKFTKKHKSETEQLLKSMRAPKKRNMEVQTAIKLTDDLHDVASEASLYPDSDASDGSLGTGDLSAVTIVTSRDLSSPMQSDFDSRVTTEIVPAAAAPVKWWESKDLPQTSESIPTSCDSVGKMTSSGSDGTSIPVHSAHGMTALVPGRAKPGERPPPIPPRPPKIEIIQETGNKNQPLQKKVTFSPVIQYYHVPERIAPLHQLPTPEPGQQDLLAADKIWTPQRDTLVQRKALGSQKLDISHLIQEDKFPMTLTIGQQRNDMTTLANRPGIMRFASQNEDKHPPRQNEIPQRLKPGWIKVRLGDPRKKPLNVKVSSEELEGSSSTSGERIALKASPARFFQSGELFSSSQVSTANVVYPEVPELDENVGESTREIRDVPTEQSKILLPRKRDQEAAKNANVPISLVSSTLAGQAEKQVMKEVKHMPKTKEISTPECGFLQTGSVATYTSSVLNPPSNTTFNQQVLIPTKNSTTGKSDDSGFSLNQHIPGSLQPTAIAKAYSVQTEEVDIKGQGTQESLCYTVIKPESQKDMAQPSNYDLANKLLNDMLPRSEAIVQETPMSSRINDKEGLSSGRQKLSIQAVNCDKLSVEQGVELAGSVDGEAKKMVESSTVTTASLEAPEKTSPKLDSTAAQTSKEQVSKKVKYQVMPYVKQITARLSQSPQPSVAEFDGSSQGKIIDMPKISRSIEELKNIFEKKQEAVDRVESVGRLNRSTDQLRDKQKKEEEAAERFESANRESKKHDLLGNEHKRVSEVNIENTNEIVKSSQNLHDGQALSVHKTGDSTGETKEREAPHKPTIKTEVCSAAASLHQQKVDVIAKTTEKPLNNESHGEITTDKAGQDDSSIGLKPNPVEDKMDGQDEEDGHKLDVIKASQIYSMSSAYFFSEERQKVKALPFQPITFDDVPETKSGSPLKTSHLSGSSMELKIKEHDLKPQNGRGGSKITTRYEELKKSRAQDSTSIPSRGEPEKHHLTAPKIDCQSYMDSVLQKVEEQVKTSEESKMDESPKQWLMDVIPKVPAHKSYHPKPCKIWAQAGSSKQGKERPEVKPVFKFVKMPSEKDENKE